MIQMKLNNYIDGNVKNVIKVIDRNKYAFRVVLKYEDRGEYVKQHSGFRTRKEAEEKRAKVIAQLQNHTYIVNDRVKVKELLEYWLEYNIRIRSQSVNTYNTYKNVVDKHVVPYIGSKYILDINRKDIKEVYDENGLYSDSMLGLIKTVLITAFNYAIAVNILNVNPAEGVLIRKKNKEENYHTRKIDVAKTLNLEQMKMLLEAGNETPIRMQLQFNMLMGLRRQEINGVRYSDINYLNHTLTIRRQLGKELDRTPYYDNSKAASKAELPLKTKSSYRVLPIPDYVFDSILEERAKYEKNRNRRGKAFMDSDYICCSSYGRPRSKDFHYRYFKELLRELGLPDVRWHDLRASYTTLLLSKNFSSKAVSKLMGHAKEIITVDVYGDNANMIPDDIPELLEFIEEVRPSGTGDKRCNDLTEIDVDYSDYIL